MKNELISRARKIGEAFRDINGEELESTFWCNFIKWNLLITIVRFRDGRELSPPDIHYIVDSEESEISLEMVQSGDQIKIID